MTPPDPDGRVVLRLVASGDELPAQVSQTDGDVLTLLLDAVTPSALENGEGVIEYTTARGVHRVPAAFVPDASRATLVRVHPEGPEDVVQRRDYLRVDAYLTVRARIADDAPAPAEPLETTTLNVSAGGMLLRDPFDLPPGTDLELEVELGPVPDGSSIQMLGRVVRAEGPEVKGVRIVSIAPADRERLVRYVTAREREALKWLARKQ